MSTSERLSHGREESTLGYFAGLLDASGRVPDEQVDWDAFHARLAARAELPLARLRYPHLAVPSPARQGHSVRALTHARPVSVPWWEHTARWSRLVLGASAAAGIVLVTIVRASPKDVPDTIVASATATDQADVTRAAFESTALGGAASWTLDSGVLPSAADLLIPSRKRGLLQ